MKLKNTEQRILTFIVACQSKGFTPSLTEIKHEMNFAQASTASYHVRKLIKVGYLTRIAGTYRNLIVNEVPQ